ncbi:hypothetical protein ACJW30_03G071900 [Castanea mollissima]
MVCFLACFGNCKRQKHRNLASLTPSTDQSTHGVATEPQKQDDIEEPISLISESKVPLEEPTNCGERKKVTFDLNVKTCEKLCTKEVINTLVESNEKKEGEKKEEKAAELKSKSFSDLIAANILSYPTNYRYQNCPDCEDEDLVKSDFADDEKDEGGDNQTSVQEESSESLFSLSIDSRKYVSANETGEKEVNSPMPVHASSDKELKTIGLSPIARDRSQYVHSVLNPIENLTQWKTVQATALTPIKNLEKESINLEPYFNIAISPEKENINLEPHFNITTSPENENINIEPHFSRETSPEPSFKQSKRNLKPKFKDLKSAEHEVAVDTSLSSWLVESETTPKSSNSTNSVRNASSEKLNSPRSHEDRPILGALTIKELRQYSASASPRWSRSRSPDDTPIIGTVGSYWSHTGQTMDSISGSSSRGFTNTGSKKREDERMKWNSIPFEERLERVLERGTAEV